MAPVSTRQIPRHWLLLGVLGAVLLFLFAKSLDPNQVLFANDSPLGARQAEWNRLPGRFTGSWDNLFWMGEESPAASPGLSMILASLVSPVVFLKMFAPFSLLFLGFSAWLFFRQLNFDPMVCVLGGIAAGLNMHFFSIACWGQGQWNLAAAMIFLALAALCTKSITQIWAKALLAGLAVGINLMDGFDVGAILSVYVGLFIVWRMFSDEGTVSSKVITALCTEALVIFFAAFIAAHSITSLVATQVEDVVWASQGAQKDTSTSDERWAPATRWSLPKLETLRVIIPGIFGYSMTDRITVPDKSSAYWGTVGEDPRITALRGDDPALRAKALDGFILNAQQRLDLASSDRATRIKAINALTSHSGSAARFSGSGEYAGLLVCILGFFALANSWRRTNSPYSRGERRAVWFWAGAALFSLVASCGRYAFLYRLIYKLPYASSIRNPIKFMHPFHLALLILAAYGLEALSRQYVQKAQRRNATLALHLQEWWAGVAGFEKKWAFASLAFLAVSVVGLFVFSGWKTSLIEYLVQAGIDTSRAIPIAGFSVNEARWFVALLLVSIGVILAIISGAWSGQRARWAWIYLGAIMILDLSRADQPWIRYFDYKLEYAANSVVDFLAEKPYEHRVSGRIAPRGMGAGLATPFGQVYNYWQQNDFPYHNIQTIDFAQWPRIPELDAAYMKKFALQGDDFNRADLWPAERLWRLTNTRYILTMAAAEPIFNKYAESPDTFRMVARLHVRRKPGVDFIADPGDATVVADKDGPYAVIEFTNALPRAKLYAHWQSPTNDEAALDTLLSRDFDPNQTVLVAHETPVGRPPGQTNIDPGTVTITDYHPKHVALQATVLTPAVLLFNDRIGPSWKVLVDQQPAPMLRCNCLMRGVFLTPGAHNVDFRYEPPLKTLYLSFCAWGIGILTAGYLVYSRKAATKTTPTPAPLPTRLQAGKMFPTPQPEMAIQSKQKRRQAARLKK